MNHRFLLLLVPLTLTPACKKDPRGVMHTEEIGNTGFVIDLPEDTRTRRYSKDESGRWDIKHGDFPDGYVILRKIDDDDRIPDEEWATSYCHGSNPVFKDTASGGKTISCYKSDGGSHVYIGKAWVPDGNGNFFDCEYNALGNDPKDGAALALSRRVCASIRKK